MVKCSAAARPIAWASDAIHRDEYGLLLTGQEWRRLSGKVPRNSGFIVEVQSMKSILLAGALLGPNLVISAQTDMPKPAYDFSLPREDRIKLAESAAPPEISSHATVYLLEQIGYVKVREGTNGFSCFVDRQTPLNSEPTCFDAEGSATTLPTRLYVEEQRGKGKSEEKINAEIDEG
jgi:hypothetical protein